MNFVALIGILDSKKNSEKETQFVLKIEKPFVENENDEWYELIKVNVSKEDFKQEIEKAKKGDILGIKGRLGITNKLIDGSVQTADEKQEQTVRAERIQIF